MGDMKRYILYEVRGLGEKDLLAAYLEATGHPLDILVTSWEGDYSDDGVPYSYLTGEGKVYLPEYNNPDVVPDELVQEVLAEEVFFDSELGHCVAVISLDSLTDLLDRPLLRKIPVQEGLMLHSHGIQWVEGGMGGYSGLFHAKYSDIMEGPWEE